MVAPITLCSYTLYDVRVTSNLYLTLHTECEHEVCHKCDKNDITKSEVTLHIEITHLCSDIPAHFVTCRQSVIMRTATNVTKISYQILR